MPSIAQMAGKNPLKFAVEPLGVMTAEEEREVITRWQQTRNDADLDRIIRSNFGFIFDVAQYYANNNRSFPVDELFNVASMGLISAAERFEADKGFKFITYAVWWMKQSLRAHLCRMHHTVSIPTNCTIDFANEIEKDIEGVGRKPNSKIRYISPPKAVRLNSSVCEDDDSENFENYLLLENGPPTDEQCYENLRQESMQNLINIALDGLGGRDRQIVELFYGLTGEEPLNRSQIADMLGLSRERVRQLLVRATQRIQFVLRYQRARISELIREGE